MAVSDEGEAELRPIYQLDSLPEEEREELGRLAGPDAPIEAVVQSDLLSSGQYGRSRLVLCEKTLLVTENGVVDKRIQIDRITATYCREFVGNSLFEVRTESDERVPLIRYTKTLAEPFQEISERINKRLRVSDEEIVAQEEEAAKVSGPREEKPTYRCPNCGHPLLSPTDVCPKCTNKRVILMRLVKFLSGHWHLVTAGLLLSVLGTVCSLGPGMLMRHLVDDALTPPKDVALDMAQRYHNHIMIVGAFFGLIFIRMFLQHFRIKVMGTLGHRVVYGLRQKLFRTLQRLSLSYFDREHTGRIMSRVLNDTRDVRAFIVKGLQQAIINGLMIIGITVILFTQHPLLAAIALLPIPVVVVLTRFFSGRFRSIFQAARRRYASLSAAVSESISGVRVVKSFAQEDREIDEFEEKNRDVYDAGIFAVRTRAKFNPVVIFMMALGTLVVWFVGGRWVMTGAITLGTLWQFIIYMNMFYNPIQMLIQLTEMFQSSATAAERVFNILDTPSEVADHDGAIELKHVEGRIVLDNVSFKYADSERVLKDVSLTVEPGEMVGLVGQTGSGKSTLVSLVCRFYDPTAGRVTLDGLDLKDIKSQSLRKNIGIVLQETFLFAGTLKENISYGKPDATLEEIIRATKAANAHDFITNLPDGYDSQVGERGVGLSGGEKQRIAIARAILKDPPILILDEATSAVDTATELAIQEAMDRLVRGRTTFAIAHRLSTLRNADELVVMQGGEIIEQGTHEELMKHEDGIYAELVNIQASFGKDAAPVAR